MGLARNAGVTTRSQVQRRVGPKTNGSPTYLVLNPLIRIAKQAAAECRVYLDWHSCLFERRGGVRATDRSSREQFSKAVSL